MSKLNGSGSCLHEFVRSVVDQYLEDMGETPPDNLHEVLIAEVERPLISPPRTQEAGSGDPWYARAWEELRRRLPGS